ncbi:MAG TPA: hypothetical protein VK203_01660 [Nostocaceae cyanobacterium]|nr:hypothetical protein [Nostocaceae cyanobacterium]
MKFKLVNWLTVCLFSVAIIAPGLVVFGVIWERHLELVKTQNLFCEVSKTNISTQSLAIKQESVNNSQLPENTKLSEHNLLDQLQIVVEQYQVSKIFQWLILVTPICIGIGIIGYDRYLVHRANVFQKQVEMLERLWQQSIEQ